MKLTVLLSVLVFLILWLLVRPREYIKYYVIHVKGNKERHENIVNMERVLGQTIHRFDAVKGSSINDEMFWSIMRTSEKMYNKNEVGCYMSHSNLINKASGEYAVIFEDDFKVYPDTHERIKNMLKKFPDFDIMMIGDCNHSIGEEIQPNICRVHPTNMICGASGYIVRTDKVGQFNSHLKHITAPIDLKIYNHIKSGDIDGYVHCPSITGTNTYKSTLGHH
jgi:GR25 family glycosyltransferase involved in LPS biosynthesis